MSHTLEVFVHYVLSYLFFCCCFFVVVFFSSVCFTTAANLQVKSSIVLSLHKFATFRYWFHFIVVPHSAWLIWYCWRREVMKERHSGFSNANLKIWRMHWITDIQCRAWQFSNKRLFHRVNFFISWLERQNAVKNEYCLCFENN